MTILAVESAGLLQYLMDSGPAPLSNLKTRNGGHLPKLVRDTDSKIQLRLVWDMRCLARIGGL
jgi:hypothetical protein